MRNLSVIKTYKWYFTKLEVIGMLSEQDKEEEGLVMNPD